MSEAADRTIPATPRRREAARLSGAMPSASLPGWIATVGVAILLLPAWVRGTAPAAVEFVRGSIVAAIMPAAGAAVGPTVPTVPTAALILPTVGVILVAGAAGLVVRFLCDGSAWRLGRAAPAFARIDPLAGLGRIVSSTTALVMLDAVVGLAVLVAAAAFAAGPLVAVVSGGDAGEPGTVLAAAWRSLLPFTATAAAVAACQWALVRHRFERRLRMTPQEHADEMRSLQADPKIRLLHRRRSNARS